MDKSVLLVLLQLTLLRQAKMFVKPAHLTQIVLVDSILVLYKDFGDQMLTQPIFISVMTTTPASRFFVFNFYRGGFNSNCSDGYQKNLCHTCSYFNGT